MLLYLSRLPSYVSFSPMRNGVGGKTFAGPGVCAKPANANADIRTAQTPNHPKKPEICLDFLIKKSAADLRNYCTNGRDGFFGPCYRPADHEMIGAVRKRGLWCSYTLLVVNRCKFRPNSRRNHDKFAAERLSDRGRLLGR